MAQWLETLIISEAIALTTHEAYRRIFDTHIVPYFKKKNLRLTELTPAHIQQYVNDKLKPKDKSKGISANIIHKHLVDLSKCLDGAVTQNIIASNPVKRIVKSKKKKFTGAKRYNDKQIEQLLECAKGDPLEIVIRLTLFYGLRRSEVLGLHWNAISFEDRTLAICHTALRVGNAIVLDDVTKNSESYTTFPISEKIMIELRRWKAHQEALKALQPNDYQDTGYVCTHADGRLITLEYVSHHFALLLAKKNMPHIRFHDLRHSSAGYLKRLGFDLKDIQVWLRHGNIQTTMDIYVDLDMEAKTNIANSLDAKFKAMDA